MTTTLRCPRCGESERVTLRRFIGDDGVPRVELTCDTIVHGEPVVALFEDPDLPKSSIGAGGDALVHELELYAKLVEAVFAFDSPVEYGVVEHVLAASHPDTYRELWDRHGHVETHGAKSYTLSVYLSSLLGTLSREGSLAHLTTEATGRWGYNDEISAWSHPDRADEPVLSWAAYAEQQGIDPDSWPATADLPKVEESAEG